MNTTKHSTDIQQMPTLSRRGLLSAIAVSAVPVAAFGKSAENSADPQSAISVDDFLARATPAERAAYHANALAEVMAEMHPDRFWRSSLNHEHKFALIVGDDRPVFVVRQEV